MNPDVSFVFKENGNREMLSKSPRLSLTCITINSQYYIYSTVSIHMYMYL